jgi:hypothetical protein
MSSYPLSLQELLTGAQPAYPEPLTAIAGDTQTWTRAFDLYPSTLWSLNYVLNSPTARFVVNLADIIPTGNGWTITIPGSETQGWTPGVYQWLAVVQSLTGTPPQRFTVALGSITVSADILDASTPQDTRSPNEIALANINLMLAGRANDGVQEYMIQGRSLRRYTLAELMQLRSFFLAQVKQERADRGQVDPPRTVAINFGSDIYLG